MCVCGILEDINFLFSIFSFYTICFISYAIVNYDRIFVKSFQLKYTRMYCGQI